MTRNHSPHLSSMLPLLEGLGSFFLIIQWVCYIVFTLFDTKMAIPSLRSFSHGDSLSILGGVREINHSDNIPQLAVSLSSLSLPAETKGRGSARRLSTCRDLLPRLTTWIWFPEAHGGGRRKLTLTSTHVPWYMCMCACRHMHTDT